MRIIFNYICFSLLFSLFSCSIDEPLQLSDAEIIEMIIDADKFEVPMNDIPENSQNLVEENYIDYMGMAAKKANGLGYEVDLAGLGHRSGHRNELYFNLDGRKLDPNDWGENKRGYQDKFNRDNQEDWSCFELVFPISFDMPDGSIVEVNSDDEQGWSDIKSWFELNRGSREKPSMQFPVVIFLDNESITLNNNDDFRRAYAECNYDRRKYRDGKNKRGLCFELIHPVTYIMPDGSSITVTSDDESGWSELKSWYENNSGYEEERPEIEYPVSIAYETDSGDSIVVVDSDEDMMIAKEACSEIWEYGFKRGCFELIFPVQFMMPNGTIITIEVEDDYMEIKNWYVENPDIEQEPTLIYPVDIHYYSEINDSIATVESEEDMIRRKEQCWEELNDWYEQDDNECYTFVFPISFTMPDGSILTLESESGFREVEFWYESNSEYNQEPSLQYPIDIIIRNDEGETITTINNDEELEIVEEGCESEEGDWYDEESDSECYIFVFPISFTMPDGSNITISNDDEEGWYVLRSWYETNSD